LSAHVTLVRGAFKLDARFEAPLSGVTALFGPSGAGKSILLSALAGLNRIDRGRISLGRRVLDDVAARIRVPPHLRGVGLVFQDARLLPHLSVRGNLAYALRRAPSGPSNLTLADAAAYFDIGALLDRPTRNLSGGEKSRVALARALLSRPDLLLLDEPFAALDGTRRRAFLDVLRQMHKSFALPMLAVTHQIDDVALLADHLIALDAGRIAAAGPMMHVSSSDAFQALLDQRDSGAAVTLPTTAGDTSTVWMRADHVLLANAPPSGLSARHVWQARIIGLVPESRSSILVRLESASGLLRARVTPAAVSELGLAPGGIAWAIVKAHAI
jgi:molybdate transport system ATP-binding protein